MRYPEKLQQWLESKSEPDIITWMDISTAHETLARLKASDSCDDDYISTFMEILEKEIDAYYNPPAQAQDSDF